jgi:RND family efflux transporter MFP subunit
MKQLPIRNSLLSTGLVLMLPLLNACSGESGDDENTIVERTVNVTLATASREEVRDELYSVGRLVSKNTARLAAEINARVIDVLVDDGQSVVSGQALILLDTTNFGLAKREAEAEIERLAVNIANEERRVSRYRDLQTRDVMPQERLDDAEAQLAVDRASMAAARARLAIAEDRLSKATLVSPVDGVVERRHVSIGDYLQVGGPLVTVTDTQNLRAELPFPETVGHQLMIGQEITLESLLAPGLLIQASISQIRPEVGLMSRALTVIADIGNPGSWRPEATVEAKVLVERRPDAVVVPALSVVLRPAGEVVYVLDDPSGRQVRERPVQTGSRLNGSVEIRSGLKAGETIVAEGAYYLTDGASIMVRESQP